MPLDETAEYTCPHCGEPIQVAIDPTGGGVQHYIEDCPVCCNPNALVVRYDRDGGATVESEDEG